MKILKTIERNLEAYLMCILLIAMTVVMFIQVFSRYILSSSMQWPDEFCRYCFVTMVWFGCSYCIRHRANLRVDSLLHALKGKASFVMDILVDVITIAFYILMFKASINVTLSTKKIGSTTPSLEIPQYLLYALMAMGFLLSVLRGVQIIIVKSKEFRNKNAESNGQEDK